MSPIAPLAPDRLYRACDTGHFTFTTTAELDDLSEGIGQMRAIDAAHFGIGMRHAGYNLYVMGPPGSGKRYLVRQLLDRRVGTEAKPADWCYVHNFSQQHKPRAIRLLAGMGTRFHADMQQLVSELQATIPAVFEGDEYRRRLAQIDEEYGERQARAFVEVGEEAGKLGVTLLRTPNGFSFAPAKGDEVMSPEDYEKLPQEEKERFERDIGSLQEKLEKVIRQVHQWRRERLERVRKLNEEAVLFAVGHLIDDLRGNYADYPAVCSYLDEVQQNVIESMDEFHHPREAQTGLAALTREPPDFNRFRVNLLVGRDGTEGAPVVYEDHPTYQNLIGRVEHIAQLGALVTNFLQIKPGALHQANGGYLLLDAIKLLTQPFSWEGLKRALSTHEIRIESLGQMYSLVSTMSLEPEPIPLDAKVILIGNRLLYYLLAQYDPEFGELFKVAADFEDEVVRSADNDLLYARLVGTLVRRDKLHPFDRDAVARVIEHSARRAEDAEKLSTHVQSLADLVREADYWAAQEKREVVTRADVERAIQAQIKRSDRLRERSHEAILRGILHIDTDGERVGQVNGLSVFQLGDFSFAQPSRITANTRLGDGELVDIQREVKLGGSIHSKGVLILSSFLAARYAAEQPLSLAASLVFEQTYGQVEGDSASVAELCALLSSLANVPIRQSLAVTGSVDQFGRVQAIGAVNEKIEGYFDICNQRGLTGRQGVLIPASNVAHLMLRQDVVDAAKAGRFHVYAVETVDQALELLTGVAVGTPDAEGSLDQRVAQRIKHLAELRRKYAKKAESGSGGGSEQNDE
ncbi:MAG TPA: ATP-binding protein [Thiobacillus sp.]|nr:MAG: ATP-dependent protease [Hydrogenophilales bacterium 16-64-40]OZA34787.1 MAG: ATP-dependent protease [Hydrogenophilales bacterium 17-64-65]HQS82065.1 ATP-binding protein [Thiobacillus sp.]HQT33247.1 ATP-binding protein [Thiobacillus sp.]